MALETGLFSTVEGSWREHGMTALYGRLWVPSGRTVRATLTSPEMFACLANSGYTGLKRLTKTAVPFDIGGAVVCGVCCENTQPATTASSKAIRTMRLKIALCC